MKLTIKKAVLFLQRRMAGGPRCQVIESHATVENQDKQKRCWQNVNIHHYVYLRPGVTECFLLSFSYSFRIHIVICL